MYGSPGMGRPIQSSAAAVSRTGRVPTPPVVAPAPPPPAAGPWRTRARVGLSPTSPHSLAGMRIDPPPSLACAIGTSPAATAAADPPDDPPVECAGFHGLRAGGKLRGSVVTVLPTSGTLVRPRHTNPAAANRSARCDVTGRGTSAMAPTPWAVGSPAT